MSNDLLRNNSVVTSQLKTNLPDFKTGSVIEVDYKIIEGGKERIQTFKGLVINKHNQNSIDATFTVLKDSSFKIKVERTFPLHSPFIVDIRVIASNQARRANIANMAKLKDPIKSVRTKPFKPKSPVLTSIETLSDNVSDSVENNLVENNPSQSLNTDPTTDQAPQTDTEPNQA